MSQLRVKFGKSTQIDFNLSIFGDALSSKITVEGWIEHPAVCLVLKAKSLGGDAWQLEVPAQIQTSLLAPNISYPFCLKIWIDDQCTIAANDMITFYEDPKPSVSGLSVKDPEQPKVQVAVANFKADAPVPSPVAPSTTLQIDTQAPVPPPAPEIDLPDLPPEPEIKYEAPKPQKTAKQKLEEDLLVKMLRKKK
jgi:hypothetical protein